MNVEIVRDGGQRTAQALEQLGRDRGLDILTRRLDIGGLMQARPAPGEPVRLIGLVAFRCLEFLFEMGDELIRGLLEEILVDHALLLEARGIDFAHRGMLADLRIHQRLV